ncbi:alpha/beta fold hydrolase [Marinobacterium sedimentorum]|uniref:alpha/beta fold hydrolase n=1 Tax=Marinobacterium sedimentorum TaxID=2927804 RepID=UPI0020C72074|nr:alpha/beta fold hydrolase [Marinobacterium sedimentorum]MCP8688035.1 alpha/beta fold hydrolase [Marinobacterium sedimentorum]
MNDEITILVHGFNRGRRDMAYLEAGLRRAGWQTRALSLPTLFGDMNDCVAAMATQLDDITGRYRRVHYVAHSLGGLITLNFIRETRPQNVGHCVFIATPHGGSPLAQLASRIPGYARIFKPVAELMPTAAYDNCHAQSDLSLGVIAGCRNSALLGKLFLSGQSDGRVEVASACAGAARETILLPYGHQDIHHRPETCAQVLAFLSHGRFSRRD